MNRWRSIIKSEWFWYSLLALLILAPLLKPGYILTLDMVFTPHLRPISISNSTYLFSAILHLLNFIIPSQIIEKLMLFAILILSGVGAHRLAFVIPDRKRSDPDPESTSGGWTLKQVQGDRLGAYFAGILYMINPFTYSRLMAGQFLVVAAYALLPWFVMTLLKFLAKPNWRSSLAIAAWAAAISILSIHFVFFLALLTLIILAFHARSIKPPDLLKFGALAVAVFLLISSYWLLPLLRGKSPEAQAIQGFSATDTHVFRTDPGMFGLPLNVFSLAGFWDDSQSRYELPWERVGPWPVSALALMILVVYGVVLSVKRSRRTQPTGQEILKQVQDDDRGQRDRLGIALAIVGLIAAMLALGDAWRPLAPFSHWLTNHVPFYRGYREPGKFIALTALAYAYLGGKAVGRLSQGRKRIPDQKHLDIRAVGSRLSVEDDVKTGTPWAYLWLALPILLAPTMLWGFDTQLRSANYPADWYAVNQTLNHHPATTTLFLPWHQYLSFDFAGRVVSNPAPAFFDRPVVAGDNPEYQAGEPESPITRYVLHELIPAGQGGEDIAPSLTQHGFGFVILAKTTDYKDYSWLDRQPHIKQISSGSDLILYEVTHE